MTPSSKQEKRVPDTRESGSTPANTQGIGVELCRIG